MCGFDLGFTTFKIENRGFIVSNKVVRHEKVCSNNQHVFIPFVVDTINFLAPNLVD